LEINLNEAHSYITIDGALRKLSALPEELVSLVAVNGQGRYVPVVLPSAAQIEANPGIIRGLAEAKYYVLRT